MEKNIILTTSDIENRRFELGELLNGAREWASVPVRLLAQYYSSVLERKVSTSQTWRLIEVQTAFFAGIFPVDLPVVARLLALGWFVSAMVRCRKSMK